MSMILGLGTLTEANIARVLADPPLIWQLIAPDDPEMYTLARSEGAGRPGLLGRLFGRGAAAPEPAPLDLGPNEGVHGDLDKAWHGLHYLFTQTAFEGSPPLNFLLAGGREIGTVDVGYGPARVFSAAETGTIHAALSAQSDEALAGRFAPSAMMKADIYPAIWNRPPEQDDTLGYLMENLETLRAIVAKAAADGTGLVIFLS